MDRSQARLGSFKIGRRLHCPRPLIPAVQDAWPRILSGLARFEGRPSLLTLVCDGLKRHADHLGLRRQLSKRKPARNSSPPGGGQRERK